MGPGPPGAVKRWREAPFRSLCARHTHRADGLICKHLSPIGMQKWILVVLGREKEWFEDGVKFRLASPRGRNSRRRRPAAKWYLLRASAVRSPFRFRALADPAPTATAVALVTHSLAAEQLPCLPSFLPSFRPLAHFRPFR